MITCAPGKGFLTSFGRSGDGQGKPFEDRGDRIEIAVLAAAVVGCMKIVVA
jgi:hypothetical protein